MSFYNPNLLKDKVAFVTGGGSGICKGIALEFLKHGAHVVIVGRKQDRLDTACTEFNTLHRGKSLGISADVRNYNQVQEAVAKALDVFGRIDIVINGAAGNFLAPVEKLSSRGFQTVMEIDLVGTYNVSKACLEALKQSRGTIINISAKLDAMPMQSHASAAKNGVDSLTRSLCIEWGPYGIRVNAISPGMIEQTEGAARLTIKGTEQMAHKFAPLQRWGTVQDIADSAVWLASDAARYVSGMVLDVDGGFRYVAAGMSVAATWFDLSGIKARL
jgi:peroxisomal 2,4-dienoyl-CoA reductase